MADQVAYAVIVTLVVLLVGLTYSYWRVPRRCVLRPLVPAQTVVVLIALFFDLVIAPGFEPRRSLPLLGGTYSEATTGPLYPVCSAYTLVLAVGFLVSWVVLRRRTRPKEWIVVVGYAIWLAMIGFDALSHALNLAAPPTAAFGFLIYTSLLAVLSFYSPSTKGARYSQG
jgi:hypothetical protein